MAVSSARQLFLKSEKAVELRKELQAMVDSMDYNTRAMYSLVESSGAQFVDKHINYMSHYPTMDHWQYVSNLKLKTKVRK
ncbi:MAG: hypothetical protein JWO07_837 [Candidatus Saccharibacteria bacterium]|nr:hypothetical protein [Candidatus Saccharibacteria bacterium]